MKDFNEDSQRKKSLVFFTNAPQGTLGDPSAVSKLINQLKAKYPEQLDITLIVCVEPENKERVLNVLPHDINILMMRSFNTFEVPKNIHGESHPLPDILKSADGLVFFPTFHFVSNKFINNIAKSNKPLFISTEYNLHQTNRKKQLENQQPWMAVFETGLGEDNLGIFCTDEKSSTAPLSEIEDENDKRFRDFLLSMESNESLEKEQIVENEKEYHSSHELFFGYFNKINAEHNLNTINPMVFIESCLKVAPSEKNIDIVLPLMDIAKDENDTRNFKTTDSIIEQIKKTPALLENYQFEFYLKDDNGQMRMKTKIGEGKKVVRLMNGFPFTPDTVDKFMKASNSLVLMTGDQSLSEAISNEKLFLYQTMWWKEPFFNALLSEVEKSLSKSSLLYKFLQIQIDGSSTSEDIKDFLNNHHIELVEDVKKLKHHLLKNANLYNTLSNKLISSLNEPSIYIQECFKNQNLDIEQVFRLWLIFPEELNTICALSKLTPKTLLGELLNKIDKIDTETFEKMINTCERNNYIKDNSEEFLAIISKLSEQLDEKNYQMLQNNQQVRNISVTLPNNEKVKLGAIFDEVEKANEIIKSHFNTTDHDSIKDKLQRTITRGDYFVDELQNPPFLLKFDPATKLFLMIPQQELASTRPKQQNESIYFLPLSYNLLEFEDLINSYFNTLKLPHLKFTDLEPIEYHEKKCFSINPDHLSMLLNPSSTKMLHKSDEHRVASLKWTKTPSSYQVDVEKHKMPKPKTNKKTEEFENKTSTKAKRKSITPLTQTDQNISSQLKQAKKITGTFKNEAEQALGKLFAKIGLRDKENLTAGVSPNTNTSKSKSKNKTTNKKKPRRRNN